jgi:hypothetical protein
MNEPPADVLYCANHPDRQTLLRCNRCNKPICNQCAVLTPTGYRCKECVRGQQKRFDTTTRLDLPLAGVVAFLLGFAGSFIPRIILFFTIFVAPVIGFIISESVRFIVHKRRSHTLFIVTAGAAAVGSLPLLAICILNLFGIYPFGFYLGGWMDLIWQGLYAFLLTVTVYYRLSGIQL